MPRKNTTRICNVKDVQCYDAAEFNLMEEAIEQQLEKEESSDDSDTKCNCLPLCNELQYDADVTDVVFNWKNYVKASKMPVKLSNRLV